MSQQYGGEPGGAPPAFTTPRDAKAQAKAAKAYAKAQRPWYKKKRFIIPLLLLVLIGIIVATSGGDDATTTDPDAGASAPTTEDGAELDTPTFAGAEDDDVVGAAGDALTVGDAEATATALVAGDATLGATLCATVTLSNSSDETIDFNAFDWKLQIPAGTILDPGFAGSPSLLSSGGIAPGGTATGDVCFDSESAAGQYVLFYEPVFSFFSNRAAWINTL